MPLEQVPLTRFPLTKPPGLNCWSRGCYYCRWRCFGEERCKDAYARYLDSATYPTDVVVTGGGDGPMRGRCCCHCMMVLVLEGEMRGRGCCCCYWIGGGGARFCFETAYGIYIYFFFNVYGSIIFASRLNMLTSYLTSPLTPRIPSRWPAAVHCTWSLHSSEHLQSVVLSGPTVYIKPDHSTPPPPAINCP